MLNLVFLCFVVISLYYLLVIDRFYASVIESPTWCFSLILCKRTIIIVERKHGGCRTNSPTSARHEYSLEYIRIWATPRRRLVFWDDVLTPYKWYQRHTPNLIMCVGARAQQTPVKLIGLSRI